MGAGSITDSDISDLDIEIIEIKEDGDRALKIPGEKLSLYIELIKSKLDNGFWNEVIGSKEIIFIFKFKNGSAEEYELSLENEAEVSKLCSEFANVSLNKTSNVYKYISGNKFYHDFMIEHYTDLINRK
jgi:hypothetical protein